MLIEAAIVLPLIVLLLFAVLEYGWLFMKFQHVTNAARQGARAGARADGTSADVTTEVQDSLNAQEITTYTLTLSPTDAAALSTGDPLTVTVQVPYSNIALTGFALLPLPVNLRASVTMAKEGP